MSRLTRLAIIVIVCAAPVASLAADAIRLNGGQVLEGRIIEESDKTIIFESDAGILTIPRSDVVEVERPGDPRIPRVDREGVRPANAAALSLIPFYSGFYRTRRQELGVFPALMQGALLLQAIKFNPFTRKTVGVDFGGHYLGGPYSDGARNISTPLLLPTLLTLSAPSSQIADAVKAERFSVQFLVSDYLYHNNDAYIPVTTLDGEVFPLRRADEHWRRGLYGYIIVAALHATAVYFYASYFEATPVSSREAETGTEEVFAYAIPNGDDGLDFGLLFRF